ncbi:hypothetical protein AJ88_28665 [Mesorhizobium amorphae CCBAU 01583]|nr:hypothetical protein AJ88_28665 [Mesorhizobium amorphae CCBAU 01583]
MSKLEQGRKICAISKCPGGHRSDPAGYGDAAICASAVQAVVEPQSTGISGDCFVLYCPAGKDEVIALNGSDRAPVAATIDLYRGQGMTAMPTYGPHSVTVPDAPKRQQWQVPASPS